jgi:hypothetical protein
VSVGLLLSIARQAREAEGVMQGMMVGGDVANPFTKKTQLQA